jgi:hypothetical protein
LDRHIAFLLFHYVNAAFPEIELQAMGSEGVDAEDQFNFETRWSQFLHYSAAGRKFNSAETDCWQLHDFNHLFLTSDSNQRLPPAQLQAENDCNFRLNQTDRGASINQGTVPFCADSNSNNGKFARCEGEPGSRHQTITAG